MRIDGLAVVVEELAPVKFLHLVPAVFTNDQSGTGVDREFSHL